MTLVTLFVVPDGGFSWSLAPLNVFAGADRARLFPVSRSNCTKCWLGYVG